MDRLLREKALRAQGVIFGEYHTKEDRDRIEAEIRDLHRKKPFQFLLSEEVGEGVYLTAKAIRQALKEQMWSISDRTYLLCLELGIPAIGIDIWDKRIHVNDRYNEQGEFIDARESFLLRETRMKAVIATYLEKGRLAVIVGDTHLRKSKTPELGNPSPIGTTWYADKSVCIIRSPVGEIL